MNQDIKDIILTMAGVVFAKVVDVLWDEVTKRREEKNKTPHRPDKESKES